MSGHTMIAIHKHILTANKCYHSMRQLVAIQRRLKTFTTESEVEHRVISGGTYTQRPNVPRVGFDPHFDPKNAEQLKAQHKKSRKEMISKAMTAYLESAKQYDSFITDLNQEFETGRRHLANIMGTDAKHMTQQDIDKAIEYLMPSGLFSRRARPVMRPPTEIYPKKKTAQFDAEGKPFNSFFYTSQPNFYESSFKISEYLRKLNDFEDRLMSKGVVTPPDNTKIDLLGSEWLSYKEMKAKFLEYFTEKKYQSLIEALERLVIHPYSKAAKDFIMEFRKEVKAVSKQIQVPPLMLDHNARPYMTGKAMRKYCIAEVVVRGNGTGKVDINGKDLLYFEFMQDREQVMSPLVFCGLLFKVDIECKTYHEEKTKEWSKDAPPLGSYRGPERQWRELGTTAQSGAIRLALALALRSFVDEKIVERMRLAGLLTADIRHRERKKWGQEGARRKYTWKKR